MKSEEQQKIEKIKKIEQGFYKKLECVRLDGKKRLQLMLDEYNLEKIRKN
jgi:hypothetical protein